MWDRREKIWTTVLLGNIFLHTLVVASPVFAPQFLPGGTGRNIRHLPCVSRRTGETGVCMFAFTCAKANGTHLGTCIDRFYFGSCCKIEDEPEVFPQDNTIDDGPSLSRPYATTQGPIESNDIPEYFSRPKPEKKPSTTYATVGTTNVHTTESSLSTLKQTTKVPTKKPETSTAETTTQSVRLSTFQTVQNISEEGPTTEVSVKNVTSAIPRPQRPLSTAGSTSTTSRPSRPSQRPTTLENATKLPSTLHTSQHISKPTTKKPIYSSTVQRPTQTTTQRPQQSTTTKSVSTTTQRVVPATRFPPRNSTTAKPPTQGTTRRPATTVTKRPVSLSTKRPSVTTKKPSSSTKRPSSPSKPSAGSTSTKPTSGSTVATKPTSDSTLGTKPTTGSTFGTKPTTGSTQGSTSSPSTKPSISSTSSTKPSTASTTVGKPSISSTVGTKPTIASSSPTKPPSASSTNFATTEKPRPVSVKPKPTISTTTSSTPAATKPLTSSSEPVTSVGQKTTTTTTEEPISDNIITTDRLTTQRPVVTTTTRPKPTRISSTTVRTTPKPQYTTASSTTEKTKPLVSTSGSTLDSTKPKPTEKPWTKPTKPFTRPPIPISSTSSTPAPSTTSSTLGNVETSESSSSDTSVVDQTTYSPGFVTWTSNSDETGTKTPQFTTESQEVQTASEWTPITSPDGWVMIQAPTTEKPQTQEESTSKPVEEPTEQPLTSAKPTTESSTTEYVTTRPTIPTLLSTIATVTIDPALPVPMETLNMSDYKQVCGRRLFPESRIVGGDRSTFGKWPWQISLRQWKTSTYLHKCGAALLNENWAITAAHCVENVPPSDLLLRIGEHDLANEEEPYGFQERRVQIVASHPQFDPRTFEYDLALLRFYEPLSPFQPNVLPICLPDDDESFVGRTAYVTGWGRLYDDGPLPSVLQEVAVPVINNTVCESMYRNAGYIEHIPHIFICAGWRNGGFDSCEGDSGGPMVIQRARDKRWVLAGVISWGIGCAVPNQPGVYTRISEFREWINQILQF